MQIQVKGKQIDVGDALSEHVEEHVSEIVSKYFDRPVDAVITFSRDARAFRCDAHVHLPTGIVAQSSGKAPDIYAAFEHSAERIEKQLRRYKRRLRDHHRERPGRIPAMSAPYYVLESQTHEDEVEEPESLKPVIIAETRLELPSFSVGEAVMQMELADRGHLLFRNDATGRFNLVYRRDDGNVGWIDPDANDTNAV
jgi:ribosomal subunit interface protein